MKWMEKKVRWWGVGFALFIEALLVAWIGCGACPNKTEIGHMGAAVYSWHTFRFDVFCVNPPLARMISGLPVLLCDPKYNWDCYSSRPQERSEWAIGNAFVAANAREELRRCFLVGRWALIPLLMLGGYFGFRLSRETYGDTAGFVFLVLWCFSPLHLAWGATMCPDALAAAMGLIAIYALRQWLHGPSWMRAGMAGICLGLLPLTKLTWIIGFGVWPLIWCFWTAPVYWRNARNRSLPRPPFSQLIAVLSVALYSVNAGYLFNGSFRPLGKYTFVSQMLRGQELPNNQQPSPENRFASTWLGRIPIPLPADLVQGIDVQRFDFERGAPSYLRGQWANHGWWYYYLYVLALKEPLGTCYVVALAAGTTMFGRAYSPSWRDEMLTGGPFVAVLVLVSSQTGLSAHPRYILPALPFLFVWASKVGLAFELHPVTPKRLLMARTVMLALTWTVGSSGIYPHSLSYINELATVLPTPADKLYPTPVGEISDGFLSANIHAGPYFGPRHLLGSNIDWGQDLFYLERWCESHADARPIRIAYFGAYRLDRSNVGSSGSPPRAPSWGRSDIPLDSVGFGPLPGWYAVSVNELYDWSPQYRYFLNFCPIATAGYSIYIYHITFENANRVRIALGLVELPENWEHDWKSATTSYKTNSEEVLVIPRHVSD